MRIGVIQPVAEDLLTVRSDDGAGELAAVNAQLIEATEVGHLDALHPGRGQHARRRQLGDDLGKLDRQRRLVLAKVVGDALQVAGLGGEVQLLQHHGANLDEHRVESVGRCDAMQQPKDPPERRQIDANDLVDVGILNLDRDGQAGLGAGAMNLPNRCRGHRLGRKRGKDLTGAPTGKLLGKALLDVVVGPGRHAILQRLQLGAKRLRQHVGHDADELTDLDEQPAEPLDATVNPPRIATVRFQAAAASRHRARRGAVESATGSTTGSPASSPSRR
jgi:hypothetical protein